MKKLIVNLFIFSVLMFSLKNNAMASSPYQVVNQAGNSLFSKIAQNQEQLTKTPELMRAIVEAELAVHVDFKYAAYRVLGKHLKKASKEQRQQFVLVMRENLISTYTKALLQYTNQEVVYEAEKPTRNKRKVAVRTQIIDDKRPTIDLVFNLREDKKTQQWKVYDMSVEGISLLTSKQREMSRRIAKYGLDSVIEDMSLVTHRSVQLMSK